MRNERLIRKALILAVGACLVLGGTPILAQSKAAKEAENLKKTADDAEKNIQDVVDHVKGMLETYNAIVGGTAKNAQSDYKKLAGDLKSTDKKVQSATKGMDSMNKQADKFFVQWEKELAEYSSESMKEKSTARLDAAKKRYQTLGQTLDEASKAFEPLMQNLNDQILFLGRDLSDAAIADLQDEATGLNQQAEDVFTNIQGLLAKADEADAAIEEATAD
jgi:ElaB/YqjD/DUF883 family membrane-anchored ribosome-binding protein